MDWVTGSEAALLSFVRVVRMLLEGIGAMWVVVGLIFAMAELISAHLHRCPSSFTQIRLTFTATCHWLWNFNWLRISSPHQFPPRGMR